MLGFGRQCLGAEPRAVTPLTIELGMYLAEQSSGRLLVAVVRCGAKMSAPEGAALHGGIGA